MSQARQQAKTPKQKEQKVPKASGEKLFVEVDQWVEQFQQQDMQQLDDRALWTRWIPLWIERGKAIHSRRTNDRGRWQQRSCIPGGRWQQRSCIPGGRWLI